MAGSCTNAADEGLTPDLDPKARAKPGRVDRDVEVSVFWNGTLDTITKTFRYSVKKGTKGVGK